MPKRNRVKTNAQKLRDNYPLTSLDRNYTPNNVGKTSKKKRNNVNVTTESTPENF